MAPFISLNDFYQKILIGKHFKTSHIQNFSNKPFLILFEKEDKLILYNINPHQDILKRLPCVPRLEVFTTVNVSSDPFVFQILSVIYYVQLRTR